MGSIHTFKSFKVYSGKLYGLSVSLMIVGKHIAILPKKANFPVLHALYSAV